MASFALEVFRITGEVAREIDVLIRVAKALLLEEAQSFLIIRLGVDQDHAGTLLDEELG